MACVGVRPTIYGTIRQTVWVCFINCMDFSANLRCCFQWREVIEKQVSTIGQVAVTADFFCFEGGGWHFQQDVCRFSIFSRACEFIYKL